MKGRHDTYLFYVHPEGEREVGLVQCVPCKGDIVYLLVGQERVGHRVEQVTWMVSSENALMSAFDFAPFTIARALLTRCE